MNTRECSVLNCKERFRDERDGLIFYRFPEDEEERRKWLAKCGREAAYNCSQSVVCARHFSSDDFEKVFNNDSSIVALKKGIVPHLNVTEIKQEPLDSDECEFVGQLSTESPNAVLLKTEVDTSFFECSEAKDNQPNALSEEAPVESLLSIPVPPIVINAVSSSTATYVPSSLPACQNWSGYYDFTVSFGPQQKTTKGVSWTYSKSKDKLYVGKDAPCPINFCANNVTNTDGLFIRATALYSSPEHASEVVHRCVNHSMVESSKGVFEAEHLVRCESQRATYEEDRNTKRHSVIVPFEIPPAGQNHSTYLYKFTCFGSCAGGPNRRPLMLIFSLEMNGHVVGRRKLDVKICACPGRDRKSEEQQLVGEGVPQLSSKRKEQEMTSLADALQFTKNIYLPPTKKLKPNKNSSPYLLRVSDKECYDFLKHMKKFYEMCKTMDNLPPSVKNLLMHHSRPKSKKSGAENEESDSDQ